MPAKLRGGCYPKYDIDNSNIHKVDMTPSYVQNNYDVFFCGVDTGNADATVFTLVGVKFRGRDKDVPRVGIINRFYHKNNVTKDSHTGLKEIKDPNDYARDFVDFVEKSYQYTGKMFETMFESADPGSRRIYERLLTTVAINNGTKVKTVIGKVNKKKRTQNEKTSVQERVDFGNVIVNAAEIEYNTNEDTLGLSIAFDDAKYDKHEDRNDNGETDIDSLDSFEYALMNGSIIEDIAEQTILFYKPKGDN